jgi:alpha,alpha-trehalase
MSSPEVSAARTSPLAGLAPDQAVDQHRPSRLFPRRVGMPQATGGPVRSPFPPIEDYAFLSDREVNALVAPSGNVEWMCVPRPDSPSVFGSMLDRAAGGFRLGPDDVTVPEGRRYLPGTMILETTWQTPAGWAIVRDALLVGPWHRTERSEGYRRPPGDHEAEQCLLRTVQCVSGSVELALSCQPVFN